MQSAAIIPHGRKYICERAARDAAFIFVLVFPRTSRIRIGGFPTLSRLDLPSSYFARPGSIGSMQFQRAHVSMIRSIRHVSLVRDWHRARGTRELPEFADFVPNERAGDSADLSISDISREDSKLSYTCRQAGPRVEQVHDAKMLSRHLNDCLEPGMAAAAKPIWDACVLNKLPVYAIIPLSDRDGCPVTVEQIFLPYACGGSSADVMVAALHACSTEGRFVHQGLLRNIAKVPLHWAVIIDPAIAAAPRPAHDAVTEINDVVLDDEVSSAAR
jgi:hypothetical protein